MTSIAKINLRAALASRDGNRGRHDGLAHGVECLRPLHHPRGAIFDPCVDEFFTLGDASENRARLKPWIGIIHTPHNAPPWHASDQSNDALMGSDEWRESFPDCRGLFALSQYHARALRQRLDIAVNRLYLPARRPATTWTWKRFTANRARRIVQVGWRLRELHAIYELRTSDYEKIFLYRDHPLVETLLDEQRARLERDGRLDPGALSSVVAIPDLPAEEYDALLSENVVFMKLHDVSASRAIVECIARDTPILVNHLEPVIEYLGEDYPLYFDDLEEAARKAEDLDLVREAHLCLRDLPQKRLLTGDHFRKTVEESEIYRSLEVDDRRLMISVITPSLNSARHVEQAIRCVVDQGYPAFEHVVVDGGSRDGTVEILKRYPHLRWISEPDPGQSHAMNKGFALARGDVVVYLNTDDRFLPGAFEAVEQEFHDGAVFVVGQVRVAVDDGSSWINDPRVLHAQMLRHWEFQSYPVNPCGYFYLRQVQENVGGFNERNHRSMDLEFLLACSRRYGFKRVPAILGVYHHILDTKTARAQARMGYWTARNFAYIDRALERMPPWFVRQFNEDRKAGYARKRRRSMMETIKHGRLACAAALREGRRRDWLRMWIRLFPLRLRRLVRTRADNLWKRG